MSTSSSHTSYGSEVEYSDFSDYNEDDEVKYSDFSESGSYTESNTETETESDTETETESEEESDSVYVLLHIPLEKEVDGEVSKKKVSCCIKFNNKKQVNKARASLFQLEEIEYWIEDTYGNWYLSQDDDIIEINNKNRKSKVDIDLTN